MKKANVARAGIFLFTVSFVIEAFGNQIAWEEIARDKINLKTVLVDPANPKIIYIGLKGGVFKTEDGGNIWRFVLSVRGQNNSVNFLIFDPKDRNILFAATGSGLYYSHTQGNTWQRIFKGRNRLENECLVLAVLPNRIYLGTKAGVFVSAENGRSWQRLNVEIGSRQILGIAYNSMQPSYLYVVCEESVFRSDNNAGSWEKIFVTGAANGYGNNEIEEELSEEIEEGKDTKIRFLRQDPNNPDHIYLATSKGVYKSKDKGKSWQSISSYGLLSQDVRLLLVSQAGQLYAATKSGIFEFNNNERWHELSSRLIAEEIRSLELDNKGNLYAACNNGLFKAHSFDYGNAPQNKIMEMYYRDEPKISDLHKAAIEYAEVEPEKILGWRKQASRKALLPKVSTGINRDTTDLWHWESGSTTKTGDDILSRGRDTIDWNVTLSWDLGELIWNDAQTSIDVRSRLMVELRDDILDEVTKLYFERIRVKMELDNLSIEDRKRRFEKELKIQELTASLDALTGGYFSNHTKEKT